MSKYPSVFRVLSVITIFGLAVGVYLLITRPWQLRWGATDEEVTRPMPGDEIVPNPTFNATRAVTINARPEEIWPWIVQIGDQRAGFYAYDWFDNRGVRSAERIIPELQNLQVGDRVPISPVNYQKLWSLDPYRSMVWVGGEDPPTGTWTWGLYPTDEEHTRLVTRLRGQYDWPSPEILLDLVVDAGDIVFMRKCMLGIKQRAEGVITDTYAADVAEGMLWGVAFIEFVVALVLIFRRREWWRPWTAAMATAATFLLVFYARPPLWIGALLGTGILAGLIWSYRSSPRLREAQSQVLSAHAAVGSKRSL